MSGICYPLKSHRDRSIAVWLAVRPISFAVIALFLLALPSLVIASSQASPETPQGPICGPPVFVSGAITANTTWSTSNLYVLNSDVTVNQGATLTIQPGVAIKAKRGAGLHVNGKLIANGNPINPVYFTSWIDDSLCGDTNGDGGATVPAARDWEWIQFNSSSDPASSLTYAEVRYGGSNAGDPAASRAPIRLVNVVPTLDRITFTNNYRNGAEVVEGTWTTNTLNSTTVLTFRVNVCSNSHFV